MSHEIALELIKAKDLEIARLMVEIDALEIRIEELEEQIPEESYSETRRTMMEDRD